MSPRILFEQELEELRQMIIEMGQKTEDVYDRLFTDLQDNNREDMERMIDDNRMIIDMQRRIEAKCLSLLTKQQPVARDLRMVSASLKVVTDIERIGVHVTDMAELLLRMNLPKLSDFSPSLAKMIVAAKKIAADAIEAFVDRKLEDAPLVIAYDDVIDTYFNEVKMDLIADLKVGKRNPDDCVDVLMITKYLEKIGDHAVNIGEWAIFQLTGDIEDVRIL